MNKLVVIIKASWTTFFISDGDPSYVAEFETVDEIKELHEGHILKGYPWLIVDLINDRILEVL